MGVEINSQTLLPKMGTLTMSLKYPKTGSRKPSNSLTIKNVTPITAILKPNSEE